MRADTDDYRQLFLNALPLLDTRAPIEFAHGAFPTAINLPLMDDSEREQVGICYKQSGQAVAIELGHTLVAGELRERRLHAWQEFAAAHPEGYLYCFRGGLRSQTVQSWMREAGVEYPLVLGGYKMMRRFLLEDFERNLASVELLLIAGKTGSGKTRVIEALANAIDLEALANHRGSSFGHLLEPQPSQIDFENLLSIEFLQATAAGKRRVILEDEGHLIGRVSLPKALLKKMQAAPLLVVEEPLQQRVQVILEDYVDDLGARYQRAWGEGGGERHQQQLQEALARIAKRLGGVLHARLEAQMLAAFAQQRSGGGVEAHRAWIASLLADYYDPMYDYQMSKRNGQVLARGSREQLIALAVDRFGSSQ